MLLLVALGYYLSGRLGLLLAIPPGYATAVWPASGIAMAAIVLLGPRAAVGVFAGSFAVNIANGLDTSSFSALLHALPVPVAIGAGAAMQALVGAKLVQRFVGYRNLLTQELQVVWMLALGGPLACLINASVGVGSLFAAGLVPADTLLFNWWTWWVGDSIGVLVFAPLVLIWSLKPGAPWRQRQLTATLPLVVMFGLVVWLFVFVSGQEQQRLRAEFEAQCHDYLVRFERDLKDDYQAMHAVAALVREQPILRREVFERFAASQLELLVGVKSLSWIPAVDDANRADFEAEMRQQGSAGFAIRELGADGRFRPAEKRARYAPVAYIVPSAGNTAAIGFDDESEPRRAEALARARATGRPSASSAITLVQDGIERRGLLIVLPVWQQADQIRGYVIAAVRSDQLLEASLKGLEQEGVSVAAFERNAAGDRELLYGTPSSAPGGLQMSQALTMAGRDWLLEFHQPASYLMAHRSWSVWTMLAGGMLFTGMTGMFLLLVIGRGGRVEQLVVERTVALARSNSLLAQEVERSQALEKEACHRAEQLSASNRELEQFAYVASHDLQAPLRNIASFARILEKRYRDKLSEEANEFLGFIRESVGELQQLIDDLLSLSKVNPQTAQMLPIPLGEPLRRATQQLRTVLDESDAVMTVEALPPVRGDSRLLTQLFQNLIANAVKFQPAGRQPQVHIRAVRQPGGDWRCEVSDNGIGIAPHNHGKLFQIFRRLNPADQYPGTGIGLALCHKIVGLHGGRIWVESAAGEGSRFCFTLPSA
ncbi:MAG: CHASE domain-containing protein [Pseudomonadota bacterium]